jgi:hypothetical protein
MKLWPIVQSTQADHDYRLSARSLDKFVKIIDAVPTDGLLSPTLRFPRSAATNVLCSRHI